MRPNFSAPLNDLYTGFVGNLRYSWDWADFLGFWPRSSRNRRNRRLEIQRGWHFTSNDRGSLTSMQWSRITPSLRCAPVPACHCTALYCSRRCQCGQETTQCLQSEAEHRQGQKASSFQLCMLSFNINLMNSEGIWLQFHAGDALSTRLLDLCIWSKRFLPNIGFCIYLGKHFQLASRCQGNLKLKIFDSSNGENRWGILEDNWNKFWKFVLSTQGAGEPPSPISEVDLFH